MKFYLKKIFIPWAGKNDICVFMEVEFQTKIFCQTCSLLLIVVTLVFAYLWQVLMSSVHKSLSCFRQHLCMVQKHTVAFIRQPKNSFVRHCPDLQLINSTRMCWFCKSRWKSDNLLIFYLPLNWENILIQKYRWLLLYVSPLHSKVILHPR